MIKKYIIKQDVIACKIYRFVYIDLLQGKYCIWLYNLSNEPSPIVFLNISHTTFQWITVKLILFFQNLIKKTCINSLVKLTLNSNETNAA